MCGAKLWKEIVCCVCLFVSNCILLFTQVSQVKSIQAHFVKNYCFGLLAVTPTQAQLRYIYSMMGETALTWPCSLFFSLLLLILTSVFLLTV